MYSSVGCFSLSPNMQIVSFERLPIELIHQIFHYLHTDEIFQGVMNLNHSLDRIVHTYDRYQLNFQSIERTRFGFILQHIHPSQVIALTLSNVDETPGEFQLFLKRFSLRQFFRLQSLRLIQPSNPTDLNGILVNLHTLASLRSLAILHCSSSSVNAQTFDILSSFLQSSTSLQRLSLSGTVNDLFEHSFHSSIDHLYFNESIFNTIPLSIITTRMPFLKSLDTAITLKSNPIQSSPSFNHLTRLILTIFIEMKPTNMNNLLESLSKLTFLKLIANGQQWFNGQFWEDSLPENLRTFQFNFSAQAMEINEDNSLLKTFQTDFWLHQKHWYVMLDYQMNSTMIHLYSLPFCDAHFYYRPTMDLTRTFRSSIPLEKSYLDHVTLLTVDLSTLINEVRLISSPHYFSNVSTLVLADSTCHSSAKLLFDFLQSILNLHGIVNLKLGQFHHPDLIELLYQHLPRLTSLRIPETICMQLTTIDFRNITSLTICDCLTDVQRMHAMFPNVKKLCVKLMHVQEMQEVMKFYGQDLTNVTFRHVSHDVRMEFEKYLHEFDSQSHRCSYEVDEHLNIHLWLGNLF